MNNKTLLQLAYEALWLVFALVAAYVLIMPIRSHITDLFFRYLFVSIFFIVTYFRFTVFMSSSVVMSNIWVKILLFVGNIPLFFFALDQYYTFNAVFDNYIYTLPPDVYQHILSGTEVEELLYIKQLTVFAGVISMVMIILLQMRIVQTIFLQSQLDRLIKKKASKQ